MKQDVLDALSSRFPKQIPSKESLNHPGIISKVAGFNVFDDTPTAFAIAWKKLGIDIHSVLPDGNAERPRVMGGIWTDHNLRYADLGVYPTTMPVEHLPGMDKSREDWIYQYDPSADDFDLQARAAELQEINRAFRRRFNEQAVMYHLYYTTLFMWPVVKFDWEPFMINAVMDPERFDEHFFKPWAVVSRKHVESLCAMDEEVIFTHDDLVMGTGPMFRPEWYEKHIFPYYHHIWEPVRKTGKKLVFVCDGNSGVFLERLLEFPIAGIMFENPATPFDRVLETWGRAGRGFIGGISTAVLTNGTSEEVKAHTREVIEKGRRYPGFIISSCGGLHGNISLENIQAYFQTRDEMGISAEGFQ